LWFPEKNSVFIFLKFCNRERESIVTVGAVVVAVGNVVVTVAIASVAVALLCCEQINAKFPELKINSGPLFLNFFFLNK